jgi:uncharacterized lipoprotein YajG
MPNAKLYQFITLLMVAACTTQPNKVASDPPDTQCHQEATTGSWITKSVCRTSAQRADEGRQLDQLEHSIQASGDQIHPNANEQRH